LEATTDYPDAAEKRNRRKRRKRRPRILQKRLCSLCYLLFKSVPVVVRAKVRAGETPGRPTGRMLVLRNAALEKHCPEPVPLFVVLIKNEISDEGAKYEHTGSDIEKD